MRFMQKILQPIESIALMTDAFFSPMPYPERRDFASDAERLGNAWGAVAQDMRCALAKEKEARLSYGKRTNTR